MPLKKYLKLIKYLLQENYKTIYFNFRYFPFHQAICFPVILSRNMYLKEMSGEVILEGVVKHKMITIGFGEVGIFDDKKSRPIWQVFGKVVFKGRAQIGHGSKISVGKNGTLILGNNFRITAESAIAAHKKIEFGENCLLSWDILIMDSDFHTIKNKEGVCINPPESILIGNHVWIGCRTTILKGTQISSESVIGTGSVVNKVLEAENCIYAGSPARLIKKEITWE